MSQPTQQGKPVWFEYLTTNADKAKAFYTELFNWGTKTMTPHSGGPEYTMFTAADTPVAGIATPKIPELANTWLAYVTVPNLQTAVQYLTSHGATILDTVQVPTVGKWVIARDAQGAVFAPFEAATDGCSADSAPDASAPRGHFCWHEFMATDREQAFAFYAGLFAWEKTAAIDMGPMGIYQCYRRAGQTAEAGTGGFMAITPEMGCKTAYWLEYVHVDHVDNTVARAKTLGGQPTFPAMNVNGDKGRIAGLVDNQGGQIAVWTGQ